MESEHEVFCCPTDRQKKNEWLERLQSERERIITENSELLFEQELLFKTLSHPIRLKILCYLTQRPNCVCELVHKLKVSNSNISYHLSYLANFSFVNFKFQGGNVFYYLTRYGKAVMKWLETIPPNPNSLLRPNDKTRNWLASGTDV
ncbi:MAG: ArsR/SmtB family transcription factor [Candidatus Hermodarchaeota archaeon]